VILPYHRVDRSYETDSPLVNLARDSFKVISIRLGGNTLQKSNYRHTANLHYREPQTRYQQGCLTLNRGTALGAVGNTWFHLLYQPMNIYA